MKKQLLLFSALICAITSSAQTLRPDVLVIGNNNAAVAAAIQSAQSKANTILLLQAGGFDISPLSNDLHSGVQATFIRKLKNHQSINDSLSILSFDKHTANTVFTKWTDSLKNLTVIRGAVWSKADRAGKGWAFKLSDGKTLRPEIFINIADQKLNAALKIKNPPSNSWTDLDYEQPMYKTSVVAGNSKNESTSVVSSLYQFLMSDQENLVYVTDANSMLLGQAAGAIAAYAGVYNLRTSETNLKSVQGELVSFNTNIIPFADVTIEDHNWKAIQFVGITGALKGEIKNRRLFFNSNQPVKTMDIKEPLKNHFYKAQIWFDDYTEQQLTIGATLDMIAYVGNKAKAPTLAEVKKKWTTAYKFMSDFNLTRDINRREFATLLQDYLPPFNITLDKKGNILR